jgi:alkylhydroperoxidase/carboxymuconolactone decarboxylase family protein YurZ
MTENPMNALKGLDGKLFDLIDSARAFTFEDGALPKKTKYIIALSLDAAHGTVEGVRALARQALKCGATKEEIMEALRVANFISGAGSIYTAARALEGIL